MSFSSTVAVPPFVTVPSPDVVLCEATRLYPSTALFVSVTVYLPPTTFSKVLVYLPSVPFTKPPSLSVSSTFSSLSLPSLSRYLPSSFCTVNFSAPLNSSSVMLSPSTVFVMTRLPLFVVFSNRTSSGLLSATAVNVPFPSSVTVTVTITASLS